MTFVNQQVVDDLAKQVKAAERFLAAEEARNSLLAFTKLTSPDPLDPDNPRLSLYQDAAHHRAICELLEKVERGEILRAIITLPPRHGKSELISRRFPPWFLGKDPSRQAVFATYSGEFAEDFGRKWRDIIQMPAWQQVFPRAVLKTGSKAADRLQFDFYDGIMVAVGRGGSLTGRGADLLVIDDPLKDRQEAESKTIRDTCWDWFTSTAFTRLMPGGRIVVVLTRWHEDDIVGRIMNPDYVDPEEAKKWFVLDLPAIANENSEKEAALWPERYPLKTLHSIRALIGPRDWNSLYQQRPTPPDGAFFKKDMIHTYKRGELPANLRYYMTFDLALTEDLKNDATACGVWGVDEQDNLWLLPDLYWEHKRADESVESIIDLMERYQVMQGWAEKGQIEHAVGPFMNKRMREREVYSCYIEGLPSSTNKGARCASIRGRMAQGKVFFPAFAPWFPAALEQMLKFTGSGKDKEDDFCDMLGLVGQGLGKQLTAGKPLERQDNVIIPGTLAWVKERANKERQAAERERKWGGF